MHSRPPPSPTLGVGDTLDGRYRIIGKLGAGGMGSVLLAEHLAFRRQVAIKVLTPSVDDEKARERFLVEARAICHLQHPNLVTYHDFGADAVTGQLYLVIELLEGRDLSKVIAKEQPVPLTRTVHILGQLCDALGEAHASGVVHRDLKPANIMLVRRGTDPDFVKLIDFGIARASQLPGPELTGKNRIIGTTGYLAPEYIARQEVSARVDLYAVGIIAYELIAGVRPFVGDPQAVIMAHLGRVPPALSDLADGRQVPPALNRVVQRALSKDPAERFESAAQLKAYLFAAARPLLDGGAGDLTAEGEWVSESSTTAIEFAPMGLDATRNGLVRPGAGRQAGSATVSTRRSPELVISPSALISVATTGPARVRRAEPTAPVTAASKKRLPALALAVVLLGGLGAGGLMLRPGDTEAQAALTLAPQQTKPVASSLSLVAPRDAEPESARTGERPMELLARMAAPPGIAAGAGAVVVQEAAPPSAAPLVIPEPAVAPASARAAKVDLGAPATKPKIAPVPFTLVVLPFGAVTENGRALGKDRITTTLTPGRHCVKLTHPLVQKTECFVVPARGGSRTVRLLP